MVFTPAWRNFKRMQDLTVLAACLIYTGAVLHAFRTLPSPTSLVAQGTLLWPAPFLILSLLVPLAIPALRRGLTKYVWMSFKAGFGQTASSVLIGIGLLVGAAAFVYSQLAANDAELKFAGVFAAYAAGIGILAAQAMLVRSLERRPDVREVIEER
ncbi:hypothetical protein ACFODL_18455 [Phenylobacterium terrae]|uniref:Uncharacterized protein n=1 Tax=Phenylobacterium terrae TaxID=2665495 RepID=A0ABW4N203_9CAUL